MPRFALMLTARYPSEKAYSVTTKETARAANEAGYQALIYAPTDVNQSDVVNIANLPILILTKLLGKTPPIIDKAIFFLRRIMIAMKFRSITRGNDKSLIVWTRDPLAGLFVPKKQQLVLELHHNPTTLDSWFCRILNLRKKLVICTLTNSHSAKIRALFTNHQIILAPMAVNQGFFLAPRECQLKHKIVFLGKGWSSGHDNNLIHIIQELAVYKRENKDELDVTFLGLEDEYRTYLEQEIQRLHLKRQNIEFIPHVPHDQIPTYLSGISIGLIPYQETEYNNQRFPIKALEYAAAGISILATDIMIHREILSSEFCYFYTPTIPGDLSHALKAIMEDSQGRLSKIEKARKWASNHSYLNRVNVVLDSFSELSKKEELP